MATTQQPLAPPSNPNPNNLASAAKSFLQAIPLSNIVPSKTNPRKNFEGPEFDDLVASVREHGVLQPILVRPIKLDSPDWPKSKDGANLIDAFYELVAGERRYRAAKVVGLANIQASVRELSDEQALELQVIENMQRKDVTALEEANGIGLLEAMLRKDSPKATQTAIVQTIAARIGKSVRYVWARLKLATLVPEVKLALEAGKIDASHADVLVTFPPKQQKQIFFDAFTEPVWDDDAPADFNNPEGEDGLGERARYVDTPISVRELKRRLEADGNELKRANWKWQKDIDGALVGAIVDGKSAPRCVGCEFNTATESGDTKKARCLNDECFEAKKQYFVQVEARHAEQVAKNAGGKMLKVIDSYFDGYKKKGFVPSGEWKKVGRGSCEHAADALQVDNDGAPERIIHVCAKKGCKVHFASSPAEAKSPDQIKKDQERRAENSARMVIAKKVVAAATKLPDVIVRHMAMVIAESWDVRENIEKIFPGAARNLKSAKVGSTEFAQACVALGLAAFVHVGTYHNASMGRKEFDASVLNLGFDVQKERAALAKPIPSSEQLASLADPKKTAAKAAVKKSPVPPSSSPKKAASPKKSTKKASKPAAKKSAKKGGR